MVVHGDVVRCGDTFFDDVVVITLGPSVVLFVLDLNDGRTFAVSCGERLYPRVEEENGHHRWLE